MSTVKQIKSTLATLRANLADDPTDPRNPRSSAAAKVRMIASAEARLKTEATRLSVARPKEDT